MLKDSKAFSGFSTNDLKQTKDFYTNKLGLQVSENKDGMPMLELNLLNGVNILIYEKPDHKAATFTVLNFPVADVEKTVDELIAKGIVFEQYSGDIQTDEKGIHRSHGIVTAWFKDPAGNILSLLQPTK